MSISLDVSPTPRTPTAEDSDSRPPGALYHVAPRAGDAATVILCIDCVVGLPAATYAIDDAPPEADACDNCRTQPDPATEGPETHDAEPEPAPPGQSLADLRLDVAAKRSAVKRAERLIDVHRALAEQMAIDAKGGDPKALGANKEDRERALLLLLEQDHTYPVLRDQTEALAADLERLSAELEIAKDARREREVAAMEQLSAALSGYGGLMHLVLEGRDGS